MRQFFEFARRDDFRRLIEEATKHSLVQGVTIDVDRAWLHAAQLHQKLPRRMFEQYMDRVTDGVIYGWWPPPGWGAWAYGEEGIYNEKLNFGWLPSWWKAYNDMLERPQTGNPIVVRVCLLPWTQGEEAVRLEGYNFPIIQERRSQARLCGMKSPRTPLVGGVSIGVGATESGTLGGIVEDQYGKRYAVTCSHVVAGGGIVDHPAQSDHPSCAQIGSVAAFSKLNASQRATPCNPRNPGAVLNREDVALIELVPTSPSRFEVASLGTVDHVMPEMDVQPGTSLFFVGKESGIPERRVVVGGLNVTFRFKDHNGEYFCFENTFQVLWPRSKGVTIDPPVESGDSGAWLCQPDKDGYAWTGMVMGCDQLIGYASFAEGVMNWASTAPRSLALKLK